MSEYNPQFMQRAIELAEYSIDKGLGGPFGAVVVKDGTIIGEGFNRVTSHNDPTAHAEIVAIRDACQNIQSFQLDDCEIYSSCEPCPMCLGAIYWARPKKLYFASGRNDASVIAGFDDSLIYDEISLPFQERKITTVFMPEEKAVAVFRKWAEMEQKTKY